MTVFPRFLLSAVAVSVLGASLAQAQPRDQRNDHRYDQRQTTAMTSASVLTKDAIHTRPRRFTA